MALGAVHSWLITYDIADRKRLGRLHRFVKKNAAPVQYSVYATQKSVAGIGRLASEIREYIKPQEDDVRIYQIPDRPLIMTLGKSALPEHVLLLGNGTGSLAQVLGLSGHAPDCGDDDE